MGTTVSGKRAHMLVPGILCLLASAPALATETQQLTLPQAVEISLQHNGDLKAFREEKGIRDAGKARAELLPNPTLELEGGTGALTGSNVENSLAIGVSQEFPLTRKRSKRLSVAERELEIYRWQLSDRERIIREEVKSAFYDAMLAEQRLTLTDRSIELNQQLAEVTRERLAAGDIPELEMNLARVELLRAEGVRAEYERALLQVRSRLFALMGLPPGEVLAMSGTLDNGGSVTGKKLAELKQLARDKRPDLKALEAEKSRGDADIDLAGSEAVPNLTAGLAFRRDTTGMEIGGVEGRDTAYTIGLKLSMPIPLFDRNQAGVQEARARRNSSESRLTAAIENVERDVETAYASALNTDKAVLLYRSSIIPQLEENLKLTQEAYRLGEIGILAVIQEQKKFFEVSDGYLTALHARQTALVKLESVTASELTGGEK